MLIEYKNKLEGIKLANLTRYDAGHWLNTIVTSHGSVDEASDWPLVQIQRHARCPSDVSYWFNISYIVSS